jgi:hypothetical protein
VCLWVTPRALLASLVPERDPAGCPPFRGCLYIAFGFPPAGACEPGAMTRAAASFFRRPHAGHVSFVVARPGAATALWWRQDSKPAPALCRGRGTSEATSRLRHFRMLQRLAIPCVSIHAAPPQNRRAKSKTPKALWRGMALGMGRIRHGDPSGSDVLLPTHAPPKNSRGSRATFFPVSNCHIRRTGLCRKDCRPSTPDCGKSCSMAIGVLTGSPARTRWTPALSSPSSYLT